MPDEYPGELSHESPGLHAGMTFAEFRADAAELVMAALVGANSHLMLNNDCRRDVTERAAQLAVQVAAPLWAALTQRPETDPRRSRLAIRCLAEIVAGQPGLHVATGESRQAVIAQAVAVAVAAAGTVISELNHADRG